MADYIHTSIICESYIFVPQYDLTDERKQELTAWLSDYARQRAPIFFSGDVQIEVELIPGSLKAKVRILGSLAAFLALYGGVRSTLDFLYKDAQWLAKAMATESMFAAKKNRSEVERVEIRTGVPGALRRVLTRLDAMQSELAHGTSESDHSAFLKQLNIARNELLRIIETLPAEEDQEAVSAGFEGIINEIFPIPAVSERPSKSRAPKTPEREKDASIPAAIRCKDDIKAFLEALKQLRLDAATRRAAR